MKESELIDLKATKVIKATLSQTQKNKSQPTDMYRTDEQTLYQGKDCLPQAKLWRAMQQLRKPSILIYKVRHVAYAGVL
jgi:hypothetical protein